MAYAQSKTISVEKIPVIDVAPLRFGTMEAAQTVALEIRQAAEEVGCRRLDVGWPGRGLEVTG